MFDWLKSLSGLEIAYFIIACIGTVALLIQIVMMLIGAGGEADADFDTDTDGDGSLDTHTDTGVSLFTVKGLTAFFAIGGWTGMLMLSYNVGVAVTVPVSVVAGLAAYFIVWALIRLVLKLQEDGTLNYASAIGQTDTVYVRIPASRTGRGKITLVLQGRYTELDAVTDETERIPVDCAVEITEQAGDAFVVRKKV